MKRSRITRARAFWFVVAVQVLVLVGMVALEERTLAEGTLVRLEAQPIDPTDLARGSYVALGYDLSKVSTEGLGVREGDDVVIGLRERGNVHQFTRAYASPDDVPEGDLFIRGRADGDDDVELESISTYFASGEDARAAEELLAKGAIVRVSLSETGEPTLCGLEGIEDGFTRVGCGLSG